MAIPETNLTYLLPAASLSVRKRFASPFAVAFAALSICSVAANAATVAETTYPSRPIRYTRVSGASYTPLALDGFEFEVGRPDDRRRVEFRAAEPNLVDVTAGWLVPGI